MNKIQFSRTLMIAAILLIVAFQGYWLNKLYREEKQGLKKETNTLFRDLVYNLQVERFKADTFFFKTNSDNLFAYDAVNAMRHTVSELRNAKKRSDSGAVKHGKSFMMIRGEMPMDSVLRKGIKDSVRNSVFMLSRPGIKADGIPDHLPDSAMLRGMTKAGVSVIVRYMQDSLRRSRELDRFPASPEQISAINITHDTLRKGNRVINKISAEKSFISMISNGKALDDTIAVGKLDTAYKKELAKAAIPVSFRIRMGKYDSLRHEDSSATSELKTDIVKVGIIHTYGYSASFDNPAGFLLKKILPQILFSFFLIAFTTIAFVFLYRNLAVQRRLTEIKNDFIGNITHELKTPIATVNVAIEALRDFGALKDPAKTKEYLDISVSELQRLALLVDKVLKFSLFEKQEIELNKEAFDLKLLTEEVADSMKLQFEKRHAVVSMETVGDNFMIDADKLHITSVVYNLLDNALKYTKEEPRIGIQLIRHEDFFELRINDNGVGIPDEYRKKIFDQFFRVPNGDRHNIKGYGLGLSYVSHILQQHQGFIEVESEVGKGSTFIVRIAFADKTVIDFGKGRKLYRIGIRTPKS